MAALRAGLVDPVAKQADRQAEKEELNALSIENAFDFEAIKPEAARITRPFDGYPLRKVTVSEGLELPAAYIVALNPTVAVVQDPANQGKVKNYHSRVIRDEETKENIHVPFDREIEWKGKTYYCAVIPSHNVRAQVCFKYDTTRKIPRIEVDRRYMLLDSNQVGRLKRVFEQVINPMLKMERDASFISGESNTDSGEQPPLEG
ncbi:MAG: hypothetical protein WC092_07555 [Anaerovoracaceae bacterium]